MSIKLTKALGAACLFNATLLFGASLLSDGSAFAQESDPAQVLAKIGDEQIKRSDLDAIAQVMGPQLANVPADQRENALLNSLVDLSLLAKKAKEIGLEDDEDYQKQVELVKLRTLHDAYFQKEFVDKIDPAEIQAIFDAEIEPLKGQEQIRARHILVETEEEAKAVIKTLEEGADFAELAKEKSTGPSGSSGGDLGFFGKGNMVPAFEEASFALETGGITKEPVQTQFGFHVIKLEERRPAPLPTLEQLEPQIRQQLLQSKYIELIKKLRQDMSVEIVSQ